MLEIKDLQQAGYPFGKNDLTIEEWRSLGTVNNIIQRINPVKDNISNGASEAINGDGE